MDLSESSRKQLKRRQRGVRTKRLRGACKKRLAVTSGFLDKRNIMDAFFWRFNPRRFIDGWAKNGSMI